MIYIFLLKKHVSIESIAIQKNNQKKDEYKCTNQVLKKEDRIREILQIFY